MVECTLSLGNFRLEELKRRHDGLKTCLKFELSTFFIDTQIDG